MSNDSPRDTSVTLTREEARYYTEMGRTLDEARSRSAAAPGSIADSFDPETALPDGDSGYLDRMLARAEGHEAAPDVLHSTDFQGPLPAIRANELDGQSPSGHPRPISMLKPGDTVAFQGTRVEVENAARLGLLVKDGAGYRLPTSTENADAAEQHRQSEAEQREQDRAELPQLIERGDEPDHQTQRDIEDVSRRVPSHALTAIIDDAATNDGTISLESVVKIGQRAGLTSEQAQQMTTRLYEGFQRQADRAAIAAGIPPQMVNELWAWANQNARDVQANAARSLALASDTAPIRELVRRFVASKRDAGRNRRD
jgi:hypothetical protein